MINEPIPIAPYGLLTPEQQARLLAVGPDGREFLETGYCDMRECEFVYWRRDHYLKDGSEEMCPHITYRFRRGIDSELTTHEDDLEAKRD